MTDQPEAPKAENPEVTVDAQNTPVAPAPETPTQSEPPQAPTEPAAENPKVEEAKPEAPKSPEMPPTPPAPKQEGSDQQAVDYMAMAKKQRDEEVRKCQQEVNAILAKYKCQIKAAMILTSDELPRPLVQIVSR